MAESAQMEISYLGNLERLELKPGDRFVLTVDRPLTQGAHDMIQQAWQMFWGGDAEKIRLLILDSGMKIGVVGRGDDVDG